MSDETDPTFVIDNIDMFQLDESRNFFPYCANNNPGDSMGFNGISCCFSWELCGWKSYFYRYSELTSL